MVLMTTVFVCVPLFDLVDIFIAEVMEIEFVSLFAAFILVLFVNIVGSVLFSRCWILHLRQSVAVSFLFGVPA